MYCQTALDRQNRCKTTGEYVDVMLEIFSRVGANFRIIWVNIKNANPKVASQQKTPNSLSNYSSLPSSSPTFYILTFIITLNTTSTVSIPNNVRNKFATTLTNPLTTILHLNFNYWFATFKLFSLFWNDNKFFTESDAQFLSKIH